MKTNYFTVHKNKTAKKAKYSKLYSKIQLLKFEECYQYFIIESELINK